jgi:hypothetical protein
MLRHRRRPPRTRGRLTHCEAQRTGKAVIADEPTVHATQEEQPGKSPSAVIGINPVETPVNIEDLPDDEARATQSGTGQDGVKAAADFDELLREDFLVLFPIALFFVLAVFALSIAFSV